VGKRRFLEGIGERSSKAIIALYLGTTQSQGEGKQIMVRQRLVFFGEKRVERVEGGSDEERARIGGVDVRGGGETSSQSAVSVGTGEGGEGSGLVEGRI
jgi:hypothetical protein